MAQPQVSQDLSEMLPPRPRDDRPFYRRALAVVAPLPMLAMGTIYLLTDIAGDGPFEDTVLAVERQEGVVVAGQWLSIFFFAFLVPAVIAVAAVSRRARPRLTAIGVALTVPGIAAGFGLSPNDTTMAYLVHSEELDVATVSALDEAWWALPVATIGSLLFIVGIVFGLLLLGIALARSGQVSPWFGVALAVGGFTHPFVSPAGHVVVGLGLWVAAAGFAGASLALLRMRDDDFAPAPY